MIRMAAIKLSASSHVRKEVIRGDALVRRVFVSQRAGAVQPTIAARLLHYALRCKLGSNGPCLGGQGFEWMSSFIAHWAVDRGVDSETRVVTQLTLFTPDSEIQTNCK